MKKKKRISSKYRFCHRLGALFSVLIMTCLLTVPAFASNNASTQKWTIVDEAMMQAENGQDSKYFKLSPYVGGASYAHTFRCQWVGIATTVSNASSYSYYDIWIQPVNFPQLWRSSLPLGANSYIEVSSLDIKSLYVNGSKVTDSYSGKFSIIPFVPSDLYTITGSSAFSSAWSVSQQVNCLPYSCWKLDNDYLRLSRASGISISPGTTSVGLLQRCTSVRYGITDYNSYISGKESFGFQQYTLLDFYNAETSDLSFYIVPTDAIDEATISLEYSNGYLDCAAVVSYWVDANKLPAGLQVGDEFPANDDAFDNLRDELLEQFSEAQDHIENDKGTFEDLRDTDTIDADTAATFFELIGSVLSIDEFASIALLICGFTVILILTRKAMS